MLDGQVTCSAAPGPAPAGGSVTLTVKTHVPVTAVATTFIPLLGATAASITVMEGETTLAAVWKAGAYVPGVAGVTGAT